jgi:signal peptidase I
MKRLLREYLPVMLAIVCLFAARSSLADHYLVPSGSMERTLFPGDHVVVDKMAYGLRVPFTLSKLTTGSRVARGDVVVFDAPDDHTRLIKRVAAVAGDSVEIKSGHVWINRKSFANNADGATETFGERTALLNLEFGGGPDVAPMRVPDGHVFVLGDARGNSRDSRYFGLVRESDIYAQAIAVFFRWREGLVWKQL